MVCRRAIHSDKEDPWRAPRHGFWSSTDRVGSTCQTGDADMNLAGLTDVDVEHGREGDDYLQRGTTPKGELFLQYISEPDSKDAPIPLVI